MMPPRLLLTAACLLLALMLAACGPAQPRELTVYTLDETAPAPTDTPHAAAAIEPTPVVVAVELTATPDIAPGTPFADESEFEVPMFAESPQPGITGTPLRFDFGTAEAQPTLAWRPPPMPVPVSIRPEDHFWFERPIASDAVSWPHPNYRYGSTYFGYMSIHAGVDLDADTGTPVLAAGPGVVEWVGWGLYGARDPQNDPYGLAVAIKHDFGYRGEDLYTVYAHLSETSVWPDQQVEAGDLLGFSGATGNTTGPHLHFEVRVGENKYDSTRNPELWLAPPTGWGVLAGRLADDRGDYISEHELILGNEFGQDFLIWTYGAQIANQDDIYRENFAISDLPAGRYWLDGEIDGEPVRAEFNIRAGQTTFVILQQGYDEGYIFHETSPDTIVGPAPSRSN